jgi:hypothetical protein
MTPPHKARELFAQLAESHAARNVEAPVWMRDQLTDSWRAARAEAGAAYVYWSQLLTRESYAVYRAAQDRADAAQDALASWSSSNPLASAG